MPIYPQVRLATFILFWSVLPQLGLPYKFAAFILDDFYLTIITTALAVITFSVKFGIHNIVVNIFDYFKYGINVVFKVWNFNIAYCSTRREFLELGSNFNLSKAFIGSVT